MDGDVAVIGLGTMGAMTLWQLARRGISAVGFEQFGVPHDRSAHGAESRIFRTAYMEGVEYVPLLRAALRGWRDLEAETGRQLLRMTGGLSIGDHEAPWMLRVLAAIKAFDLDHELLSAEETAQRFPQHRLLPGEMVIVDKQAGYLRAELAVASAVARAEQLGARALRRTRVEAIEPAGGGVQLRAGARTMMFRKAVVTVGPWAAKLLPELSGSIAVHRLVSTWFCAKDPALFEPERFPVFIRESRDIETSVSGIPSLDGVSVKVMPNKHFGEYDADSLDRNLGYEDLELISRLVRNWLPGLYPDPIRVGIYMDGYTPDGHALVGLHPDSRDVVLMVGFSGHGFKMAPVFGEIASDLVANGTTSHGIGHLSPARIRSLQQI